MYTQQNLVYIIENDKQNKSELRASHRNANVYVCEYLEYIFAICLDVVARLASYVYYLCMWHRANAKTINRALLKLRRSQFTRVAL